MALVLLLSMLWDVPVGANQTVGSPLYEKALNTYKQEQYDAALELFLQVLAQEPQNPAAHYYLGLCYSNLGYHSLALDVLLFAQKNWTDPLPELPFWLAMAYYNTRDLSTAKTLLHQLLENPAIELELLTSAQKWLLFILQEENESFRLGNQSYEEARYQDAITHFQKSLTELPDSAIILYYLGASYYQLHNYQQAKTYLTKVIALAPNSPLGQEAEFYRQVIDKLTTTLSVRPFYFKVLTGTLLDTNVNYGGGTDNTPLVGDRFAAINQPIQDGGTFLNLITGLHLNEYLETRYSYLLNLYWGLSNQTERIVNSYDYNHQSHQLSFLFTFPVSDFLQWQLDSHFDWDVLAGRNYLLGARLSPSLTLFANERLVTRLLGSVWTELYPSIRERDNVSFFLGLEQYLYLWDSNSWLRFSYDYQSINARDQLQQQQGLDSEQTPFMLDFRFANSRALNTVGMTFGFPVGPVKLQVGSRLQFADYTKADLYKQYLLRVDPLTGLALPRQELTARSVDKFRQDTQLVFSLDCEWPFSEQWALLMRYNRITNVSNIVPEDYTVSRSYLKDIFSINMQYRF